MSESEQRQRLRQLLPQFRALSGTATHATLWEWVVDGRNGVPEFGGSELTWDHTFDDNLCARLAFFDERDFRSFCKLATQACQAIPLTPNVEAGPWWTWLRYVFDAGRKLDIVADSYGASAIVETLKVSVFEASALVLEKLLSSTEAVEAIAEVEGPFYLDRFIVVRDGKKVFFNAGKAKRWGPFDRQRSECAIDVSFEWREREALYFCPGPRRWVRVSCAIIDEAGYLGEAHCEDLSEEQAANWFVDRAIELPEELAHLRHAYEFPHTDPVIAYDPDELIYKYLTTEQRHVVFESRIRGFERAISGQREPQANGEAEAGPRIANPKPRIRVDAESCIVHIDGKAWPLNGSDKVKRRLAAFIQALINADGEFLPRPQAIKSDQIERQPVAIKSLLDAQPGAGTRIPREKLV